MARWTFKVLGFCAMAGSLIFHGRKTDRRPFPGRGINFLPTTTQSQRVKGHLSHLGRSTIEFRHGGERRPHHQLEIKCPWIQEGRCAQNKVLTSSIWIDDRVTQHMVGVSITTDNTPDHASSVRSGQSECSLAFNPGPEIRSCNPESAGGIPLVPRRKSTWRNSIRAPHLRRFVLLGRLNRPTARWT